MSGIILDITFVGSFAEFVYLWLACTARSLRTELGGRS